MLICLIFDIVLVIGLSAAGVPLVIAFFIVQIIMAPAFIIESFFGCKGGDIHYYIEDNTKEINVHKNIDARSVNVYQGTGLDNNTRQLDKPEGNDTWQRQK